MAMPVCIVTKTTCDTDVDTIVMSAYDMDTTTLVLMAGNYNGCVCVHCGQDYVYH